MLKGLILESGYIRRIIVMLYIKIFKKGKIGESYNVGSNINLKNINLVKTIIKNFKKKGF